MVCAILSVGGIVLIKNILLLIEKSSPCSGGNRFLFHYPNDPLPYVQCDTTLILFNLKKKKFKPSISLKGK